MQQRVSPSTRQNPFDEEWIVVSSSTGTSSTTQNTSSPVQASSSNNTEENSSGNSASKKPAINVFDLYSVKYMLDSFVRSVLIEEKSFKEDHTLSNFKLITGFLACGGAITAYFTKTPLYALLLCIAYVSVILILALNSYFFEKGTFALAYSLNYGFIRVESDIYDEDEEEAEKRNCPKYQIIVHFPSPSSLSSKYKSSNCTVSHSWYLNDLFDENGNFDKKEVRRAVLDLIKKKGQ
ncbi:hypothetical protein C9374_003999 [Naegleria lovaniensis]|uniref:Signal peptidase complex subunit 2 n=1 Tax=Naegleria lovaniensis TaxID=51637 RepID=A0AA88H0A1_NAELO|nr:uncharacterized protein C9374_003999 [Naegleria lovaniensis]KAG2394235.1 hypothetical protein C9374_003999 [Naegleria lovaniensis]